MFVKKGQKSGKLKYSAAIFERNKVKKKNFFQLTLNTIYCRKPTTSDEYIQISNHLYNSREKKAKLTFKAKKKRTRN